MTLQAYFEDHFWSLIEGGKDKPDAAKAAQDKADEKKKRKSRKSA